jgi:PAS domain S-box-containing protein
VKSESVNRRGPIARVSLRTVLILGAILAAALPAGVLAARTIWLGEADQVREQAEDNQVLADALAVALEQFLQAHLNAVALVAAQVGGGGPLDQPRLEPLLRRTVATTPAFEAGFVVDAVGVIVGLYPPEMARKGWARGTSFADHEWFREMAGAPRPLIDRAILAPRAAGGSVVALRAPIAGPGGTFHGVVTLTLAVGEVGAIAGRVGIGESGEVVVTAADSTILSRPQPEGESPASLAQDPVWAHLSRRPSGVIASFTAGGVTRTGAFATVSSTGWKILASQSMAEIRADSRREVRASLGWLGLAFVVAVGPMIALAILIVRPIDAVVAAAHRLARGDLTTRVDASDGPAEVTELVRAFDHMAAALQFNEARLREAEIEQRTAEARMRLGAIVESSNDAIIAETIDGVITAWNGAAEAMYGYAAGEAIGQSVSMLTASETQGPQRPAVDRIARGEVVRAEPAVHRRKDGQRIEVSLTVSPIRDTAGRTVGLSTIARDVTDLRRTERTLERTHRALRAIGRCADSLIRARDEGNLLSDVCRIITEEGGYRLAWVGYAEHDPRKTVRPVAEAGAGAGHPGRIQATWGEDDHGRCPEGDAIRTGAPALVRGVGTEPVSELWRAEAVRAGLGSSLALPLGKSRPPLGILSIYGVEPDAFDAEATDLLRRLADNLAYGILALRTAEEGRQADAERRDAARQLRKRVGELTLLREVARLLEAGGTGNRELLAGVVAGLPAACQHPELATARIAFKDLEVTTPRFAETPWTSRAEWRLGDGSRGVVEVAYLAERSPTGADPFLPEERQLIETLASMLGSHFERQRAEEAVRRSERHYRSLIENAQDIITLLDARGVIIYESPAIQRVLGYAPEELVGTSAFAHIHPDDDRAVVDLFTRTVEQPGSTASIRFRFRHKDGSWRTLHGSGTNLLHDPDVAGIVVNSRNVTWVAQADGGVARPLDALTSGGKR